MREPRIGEHWYCDMTVTKINSVTGERWDCDATRVVRILGKLDDGTFLVKGSTNYFKPERHHLILKYPRTWSEWMFGVVQ